MPEMSGQFIIVNSGRCGSSLLSQMLSRHPEVLSLSEFFATCGGPSLLDERVIDGDALWCRLARPDAELSAVLRSAHVPEILAAGSAAELAQLPGPLLCTLPLLHTDPVGLFTQMEAAVRSLAPAPLTTQIDRVFDWLRCSLQRRVWVERSGGSIEYAEALRRAWPRARVIFLVRDGPACAHSMSRHPVFRLRVARLCLPKAQSVPECLSADIPLDRFGAYWSALMHKLLCAWHATPPHARLWLRYERLIEQPVAELRRLAAFLECDQGDEWLQRSVAALRPVSAGWLGLPLRERAALERTCRPGMRCIARVTE